MDEVNKALADVREFNKALADLREWLWGNLSAEDAGRICGVLSDVAWYANELEKENEKLGDIVYALYLGNDGCGR